MNHDDDDGGGRRRLLGLLGLAAGGAALLRPETAGAVLASMASVATVSELRALATRPSGVLFPAVAVLGYHARGDGGAGLFVWDEAADDADDGGLVLRPDDRAQGVGRWRRLVEDDTYSVRWFGARGDGTADDTAAVHAAVAAVGRGGCVYFPPGVYSVGRSVRARSHTTLRGVGDASVVRWRHRRAQPRDQDVAVIFSVGVEDVTVERLAVDVDGAGNAPGNRTDFTTAIGFRECRDVRIRECTVYDGSGFNIVGRHGLLTLEAERVWLQDNHCRDGLRIKAGGIGSRVVIEGNVVEDGNDNAISIAGENGRTAEYVIRNNVVTAARGSSIYLGDDGGANAGQLVGDILIDGNLLRGPVLEGQSMIIVRLPHEIRRLHVTNNVLVNDARARFTQGIMVTPQTPHARRGADFLVAHNTIQGPFDHAAVYLREVSHARVIGNEMVDPSSSGLRLEGCSHVTAVGNAIRRSPQGELAVGVSIADSRAVTLVANTVDSPRGQGVRVVGASATAAAAAAGRPGGAAQPAAVFALGNVVRDAGGAAIEESGAETDGAYLHNDLRDNRVAFGAVGARTLRAGNAGASDAGAGARAAREISGSAAWAPGPLADDAVATTQVQVPGANVGDVVVAAFSHGVPGGALLVASVTARGVVAVTLLNKTGRALALPAGALRVDVLRAPASAG